MIKSEIKGAVGIINIARPEAQNAISLPLLDALNRGIKLLLEDNTIKCLVLTGEKKAFSIGVDFINFSENKDKWVSESEKLSRTIGESTKPIISAVSGYTVGAGLEIAMACTFALAADNAKVGLADITMGLPPLMGGYNMLIDRIGKSKAMDMMLTGRLMTADEAERAGLVSRIVPTAELQRDAIKAAERIATMPQDLVASLLKGKLGKGAISMDFFKRQVKSMIAGEE